MGYGSFLKNPIWKKSIYVGLILIVLNVAGLGVLQITNQPLSTNIFSSGTFIADYIAIAAVMLGYDFFKGKKLYYADALIAGFIGSLVLTSFIVGLGGIAPSSNFSNPIGLATTAIGLIVAIWAGIKGADMLHI